MTNAFVEYGVIRKWATGRCEPFMFVSTDKSGNLYVPLGHHLALTCLKLKEVSQMHWQKSTHLCCKKRRHKQWSSPTSPTSLDIFGNTPFKIIVIRCWGWLFIHMYLCCFLWSTITLPNSPTESELFWAHFIFINGTWTSMLPNLYDEHRVKELSYLMFLTKRNHCFPPPCQMHSSVLRGQVKPSFRWGLWRC